VKFEIKVFDTPIILTETPTSLPVVIYDKNGDVKEVLGEATDLSFDGMILKGNIIVTDRLKELVSGNWCSYSIGGIK
jgi:hypothetical protein